MDLPFLSAVSTACLMFPHFGKNMRSIKGLLPTLPALYSDPDLLAKIPWFKNAADVLNNAVARPSTVTGAYYNQLSSGLFGNVNRVLSSQESAKDAVFQIERVAKPIAP